MKSTTALILILISVGLYYTVLSPQYDAVTALRDKQEQYDNVLNNVTELKQKRDALLAKYKSISPDEVDRLDKVLPDRVDAVNLARDFDTIAARHGIVIKSLSTTDKNRTDNVNVISPDSGAQIAAIPGQSPGLPALQKVDVSLNFIATYPNFKSFLKDIESSVRIADITGISFTAADNGLNQYTMNLTTYWLK